LRPRETNSGDGVSYDVFTTGKVEKAIARLPEVAYQRMNDAIDALADDPRPPGCEKLSGREGYRIRVGEWRAIYRVDDQQRRVDVVQVAHRRDVYRR
jgi:mRNA interferase RelE/StbE